MGRLILIAQCMMVCIAMYGQGFVHPGMLHNTGDLEYMRSKGIGRGRTVENSMG